MASVFVTGGSGFIGARIVETLAARGDAVTSFDLAVSPRLRAVMERHPGVRAINGEITEWPHLVDALRRSNAEKIVHTAAVVGVMNSLAAPTTTMRVNVEGALNLMAAMRLLGITRMVNISTEEIYGHFTADVIDEMHAPRPEAPYGISKYAVEQLSRDHDKAHGTEIIHARTCWVYGPNFPRQRAPMTLIDAALAGRRLHIERGGDFIVDHVHVDDTVAGAILCLDHPRHRFDAYHIATGVVTSMAEIVRIIREQVPGADIAIGPGAYDFGPGVPVVRKGALAIDRARAELGYSPRYDIRSGIAAYIAAARAGAS